MTYTPALYAPYDSYEVISGLLCVAVIIYLYHRYARPE